MSYDEQPDGDPHGECAAEIHRLETELATLKQQASRLDAAEQWIDELCGLLDACSTDEGPTVNELQRARKAIAEAAKWREGK